MRCVLSLALGVVVALAAAPPVVAQPRGDKLKGDKVKGVKPKEKEPEVPSVTTQIGGKTIDEWAVEISSDDKSKAENAIRTVRLFHPELRTRALPVMLKELRRHTPQYPIDTSVRVNLVITIGETLGAAKDPSPKDLQDGVTLLTRMLRDYQVVVRYRAAEAMFRIGPEARAALTELKQLLKDTGTWEVRQAAALALGSVAQDPTNKKGPPVDVIVALYTALRIDKASQVRLGAIQALTALGPCAATRTQAELEQALEEVAAKDTELTIRIWAHMALMAGKEKIDPRRVEFIGSMLEQRDLAVKIQACQALGAMGEHAKGQVNRLIAALDDKEKAVAGSSILTLAQIGKDARPAVPRLQEIAKSKDWPGPVRQMAVGAIEAIEGKKVNGKSE
jgi:HEAT repeat protein